MTTEAEEVFFEFRRVGHTVKVTAIHSVSMKEVSIVCPAAAPVNDMKRLALQKLVYVLGKRTS